MKFRQIYNLAQKNFLVDYSERGTKFRRHLKRLTSMYYKRKMDEVTHFITYKSQMDHLEDLYLFFEERCISRVEVFHEMASRVTNKLKKLPKEEEIN